MQLIVKALFLLAISFWIGGVFFFASIAGPSIFKTLERTLAGEVVTAIFPKYYLLGYVCGSAGLVLTAWEWAISSTPNPLAYAARLLLLAIMLGLWGYSGTVVRPEALEARAELRSLTPDAPGYEAASKRFDSLHKRSVVINGVVFIFGIATVFVTAYTSIE